MRLKAAEAKALIGKRVKWSVVVDRYRGYERRYEGIVNEVSGRNIRIDDEWRWLPDIPSLTVVEASSDTKGG